MTVLIPRVTVQPVAEPLTLGEVRAHLRVDGTEEDALILGYMLAARELVERELGLALLPQTVAAVAYEWPSDWWDLPIAPYGAVAVTYTNEALATVALPTTVYRVRPNGIAPRVSLATGQTWPTLGVDGAITITLAAGYADLNAVPQTILLAMKQMVSHWFETRTSVNIGNIVQEIPMTVQRLLASHRRDFIG